MRVSVLPSPPRELAYFQGEPIGTLGTDIDVSGHGTAGGLEAGREGRPRVVPVVGGGTEPVEPEILRLAQCAHGADKPLPGSGGHRLLPRIELHGEVLCVERPGADPVAQGHRARRDGQPAVLRPRGVAGRSEPLAPDRVERRIVGELAVARVLGADEGRREDLEAGVPGGDGRNPVSVPSSGGGCTGPGQSRRGGHGEDGGEAHSPAHAPWTPATAHRCGYHTQLRSAVRLLVARLCRPSLFQRCKSPARDVGHHAAPRGVHNGAANGAGSAAGVAGRFRTPARVLVRSGTAPRRRSVRDKVPLFGRPP